MTDALALGFSSSPAIVIGFADACPYRAHGMLHRPDQAFSVEAVAVEAVCVAGLLSVEEAAVGDDCDHPGVVACLHPAGVRAEAVGQHHHVDVVEVGDQFGVRERRMHPHVDARLRVTREPIRQPGSCTRRGQRIVVEIQSDRECAAAGEESVDQRPRIHVGP